MINLTSGLKGEYKLVIKRPDGTVRETPWFDNIILNQGLDRLATAACANYARVGTGTSTPTEFQTNLDAQIAASSNISSYSLSAVNSGSPDYTTLATYEYVFAQGAVVGNVTEVGVGWSTTGDTLFSRALILDALGNPTSVTFVSIDQLTLYYRVRWVPPSLTDSTGSVVIGGTTYGYTLRPSYIASYMTSNAILTGLANVGKSVSAYAGGCSLGAITGTLSGTSAGSGTVNTGTYTAGTRTLDFTHTFAISQGNNVNGLQGLSINVMGYYTQVVFSSAIPKNSTNVLTVVTRHGWARL